MNSPQNDLHQEQPPANSENPALASNSLLMTLREQLQELRTRFDATDTQIATYLRDNAPPTNASTNGEAMAQVQNCLDRLLAKVDQLTPAPSVPFEDAPTSPSQSNHEVLEALQKLAEHQNQLAGKIVSTLSKRIFEEFDLLRFQQVVHETLTTEWDRREAEAEKKNAPPPEDTLTDSDEDISLNDVDLSEEPPLDPLPSNEEWSRAVWGDGLVDSEAFSVFLEDLNKRLLEGDGAIANLAGQLLIFRQAPPEAKPQLLKDVGEAYYRTKIDKNQSNRPLERALIDWLQTDCEKAGLPNTIEVVHVGERFDKSRHTSTTRGGVEVSEVFGWIVLTEGGRVYIRASVAAQ